MGRVAAVLQDNLGTLWDWFVHSLKIFWGNPVFELLIGFSSYVVHE